MSEIILRDICKSYENGFQAVKNFNLEIEKGELVVFVGPSGCGKSTTLRMIAGLEDISDGELWIGDKLVNYLEPKERDLAMVFQSYALYPQMNIYDNIAFSLQVRKVPKKEIDKKVHHVAELLGLENLLKQRPKNLSGGQRQRVAIGNAIIREPKVLLMDEPLSNLDAKLRTQMRVELAGIHKALGNTIIYVTHDQTEAMTLGDRIVVTTFEYYDTICRQVANRMPNIRKFAAAHDLIFFVCGRKSSNGKILYQECKKINPNSYLIDQPEEIDRNLLEDVRSIGICGATSTPKWLMEECKKAILNEK